MILISAKLDALAPARNDPASYVTSSRTQINGSLLSATYRHVHNGVKRPYIDAPMSVKGLG